MAMNVGTLVAYLTLDDSNYRKTLDAANKGASMFGKTLAASAAGIAGLGAGVQVIGGLAGVLGAAAGALPVLVAGAVAAKFGMVALSLATDGFSEAVNAADPAAFAEAIKGLSPAAQETAKAVRGLKPAWDDMKGSLQEKLFDGLSKQVSELGQRYIPILGDSFGQIATGANGAAKSVAMMLNTGQRVSDVSSMTGDFASAWTNVLDAVAPLGAVLLDVSTVAASFLPGLTSGAGGAARSFAAMVSEMRNSGELYMMMQRGLDTLRKLGEVGGNVGEILGGIFRAADTGGASFLDRLVAITQRIADMVNSVDGQAALSSFFQTAATLSGLFMDALDALLPILPPLVDALGTLAINVGTLLVGALTALAPYLEAFASFLADNPGLVLGVAIALGTLVVAMNGLLGLVKVIGIVQAVWNAGLLQMIGRFAWAAAQALFNAGRMAASWLIAMGPVGWVIAAVVGLVALIIANWDSIVAATEWLVGKAGELLAWFGTLPGKFGEWFEGAKAAAIQKGTELLGWIGGLPGKLLGILGSIGGQLAASGRALVDDWLRGIQIGWNKLMGWVEAGMSALRSLWPFSPARRGPFSGAGYVTHSGKALTGDFAASLRDGMPGVIASARDLMAAAHVELGPASIAARPTGPGPTAGSGTDPAVGGRAAVNININNPSAERASDAIGRAGSVLAAVGPWGD